MKKIIYLACLSCISIQAYSEILTDNAKDRLILATTSDEFISAMIQKSNIAYDIRGNPIYNVPFPNWNLMQFYSYGIQSYANDPSIEAKQVSTDKVANDNGNVCGTISELSNPWNESGTNVTQVLMTASCSQTKTQTSSTTTTCGWAAELGLSTTVTTTFVPGSSIAGTISVKGVVNGSSSSQEQMSEALTLTSSPTSIIVPAGCKAVVTQTLDSVNFTGEYNFYNVIRNGKIYFTATEGSGYVDMIDLIRYGKIPQTAMAINSSGDLTLVGVGNYAATGFGSYILNYHYEEADPTHSYCNSSSLEEQMNMLNGTGKNITQHVENGKTIYTQSLPTVKTHLKTVTKKLPTTTLQENQNARCWRSLR